MKTKVLLILFVFILGVVLVFGGCSSSPAPAPAPQPNDSAPAPAPAPKPEVDGQAGAQGGNLSEEQIKMLNETIIPNLEKRVSDGKMSQDSMDLILEGVYDGTYEFKDVQNMMMGMTPIPVR